MYSHFAGRRTRWTVPVLCALTLIAAACGGDDSSDSSSSASSTEASSTAGATESSASTASTASNSTATDSSSSLPAGSGDPYESWFPGPTADISGPGVSDTTIKIGQIASVGGGVPGMASPAWQAMDALVAYVNEHGGVLGRDLELVQMDDGGDCATYASGIQDLASEVFALVGTIAFHDECGADPMAANPDLSNVYANMFFPPTYEGENSFAAFSTPPGYFTTGYAWVKANYPDAISKMAIVWPTDYNLKVQKSTAESLGFDVVYDAQTQLNQTNFTSEILRMKDAGVRVVELSANPTNVVAAFAQQAEQQGFEPDVILASGAYQPGFFDLLGEPTSAGGNIIAPLHYPMYMGEDRATNPALDVYLTELEKVHAGARGDYFGVMGWAAGSLFVEALQNAAAEGPVTRETFQEALTAISQFTAGGLLPPTNGSPVDRNGPDCAIIVGLKGGEYVRVDPADGGYHCGSPYHLVPISDLD